MDFKKNRKKNNSIQIAEQDIYNFVNAVQKEQISDKQIIEFITRLGENASNNQVYWLAKYMANSGDVLALSDKLGYCVDKHSAGSVSDGMSIILMSVLASLGVSFVKVVSNIYGMHGNLLEKLSKFRGFNCMLDENLMLQKASWCGVGLYQDNGNIAPAASKIYTVCKENDVLIEPIVSASILATKIATGANMTIVDVKSGEGAINGIKNPTALANRLVEVGKMANLQVVAVITDFNWPISASVGVGLELLEIKEALSDAKEYKGSNLLKLAKEMAICVLMSSKIATSRSQASEMFDNAIESGDAYKKFCEIIEVYGGEVHSIERTEKLMDTAVSYITSDFDGYVSDIKMDKLYNNINYVISHKGEYDANAGLVLMCAEGDRVKLGQKLAKVFYSHTNKRYFKVVKELYQAFEITKNKPSITNLFIKVVI